MAKIKDEFKGTSTFHVTDQNGVARRVPRAKFENESEKWIKLGFGLYFDIPTATAIKKARAYATSLKKAALDKEKELSKTLKDVEAKDLALTQLNKKLEESGNMFKEAKKTMDDQQKQAAKIILEKQAVDAENEKLKEQIAALNKKISGK